MSRKIDTTTQPSLMLRIRDHADETAWAEFIEVYSPLIYGFCRIRELQSSDAADVTQEVLLRVAKAIRSFEYDRKTGLFRDWLARIVLNEIRRHGKRRREVAIPTEDLDRDSGQFESSWNEQFQQHLFSEALTRARPHFTAETWEMFELSWLRQVAVEQVAAKLSVGVERIYVARTRVLKRLRYEVAILADDIV